MMEKRLRDSGKRRVSNIVLICLGLFVLSFVVAMVITFWVKGAVPDTLIQYTLGAGGVEALALAGVRISKVISGKEMSSEESGENE